MSLDAALISIVCAMWFGIMVGYSFGRLNDRPRPFPVPCMALEHFPDDVGERGSGWAAPLPDGYVLAAGQRLCGHQKGHTGPHSWEP